jgi:hypothetical protein
MPVATTEQELRAKLAEAIETEKEAQDGVDRATAAREPAVELLQPRLGSEAPCGRSGAMTGIGKRPKL